MNLTSLKTVYTKPAEVERKWLVIDAKDQPLGRVAAATARILQGKHKASFSPHVNDGDFVVIVNAYQFALTGRKENTKTYKHHTGFVGGLKEVSHKLMMSKKPWFPMEKAVKAMLPKNKLAKQMFKCMVLVEGPEFNKENGEMLINNSPLTRRFLKDNEVDFKSVESGSIIRYEI